MAKNIVYKPGDHVPAPVPSGTLSGAPLRLGGLNAVAITDRAANTATPLNADGSRNTAYNRGGGNIDGEASVWFEGAVNVDVTAGAAPTFGAPIYITAANALNVTASGNSVWGHSVDRAPTDIGDGKFSVTVRINN